MLGLLHQKGHELCFYWMIYNNNQKYNFILIAQSSNRCVYNNTISMYIDKRGTAIVNDILVKYF